MLMKGQPFATSRYDIVEPGGKALAVAALAGCVGIAAVAATLQLLPTQAQEQPALWIAAPCLALTVALLYFVVRRRSVSLEAGVLVIKAGLHTRRVPAARLELERARIVDLEDRTELLPGLRTFGASLPGYQMGWFRTRKWGKGFYLLTDRRRVLWLPEHGGP
ncbi:MAG TPA: PH domain-containing protein, partial [Lysobacter sp.]|nr:PH domain-containing protein [Lysobacter sp.]